jgi:hypothetical protein
MKKFKYIVLIVILAISYTNIIQSAPKKKKVAQKSTNYPSKLLSDSILHPGLKYSNILFGSRANKISANILEYDLTNPELELSVMKAKNVSTELDKLQEIIRFCDNCDQKNTIGAINGSFWRAFRNNPIGATIIDGQIIELNPYKEWSGIFFDKNGIPYIDNFKLTGTIRLFDGKIITLSTVNRRRDSMGIVLYNIFGGNVIPHVNVASIDKIITNAYSELLKDSTSMVGDSTEIEFDFAEFEENLIQNARTQQLESSISKAVVEFIDKPGINKQFRGIVNFIDTGSVKINENQAVISLGFNLPPDLIIYSGDTLVFKFETNIHRDIDFKSAVTATPRLVRNGVAAHEAQREGSRSRRFISGQLGRTAIGYNQTKDKLYLVTIDHANRSSHKKGASLGELAQIMKQIGCHDAMNLDGGGSSVMIINGKNIMSKNNPEASRRISVGVGVRKKK